MHISLFLNFKVVPLLALAVFIFFNPAVSPILGAQCKYWGLRCIYIISIRIFRKTNENWFRGSLWAVFKIRRCFYPHSPRTLPSLNQLTDFKEYCTRVCKIYSVSLYTMKLIFQARNVPVLIIPFRVNLTVLVYRKLGWEGLIPNSGLKVQTKRGFQWYDFLNEMKQ